MNNTFSLTRYIHFEKIKLKQTIFQLLSIIIIFEAFFFLTILAYNLGDNHYSLYLDWLRFISIAALIFSPILFESRMSKSNAMYLFTIPISNVERFLSYFLKYTLIQPILWGALYYISASLQSYLLLDLEYRNLFTDFISEIASVLVIIYAAQSICMIIYLSIKKHPLIVYSVVLFFLIYIIIAIGLISSYIYLGHSITYPFTFLLDPILYMEKWTGTVTTVTLCSSILLNFVMTIGLWSVVYLKIKEFKL